MQSERALLEHAHAHTGNGPTTMNTRKDLKELLTDATRVRTHLSTKRYNDTTGDAKAAEREEP